MAHPTDSKINGLTALAARMVKLFPEGGSGGSQAMANMCREVGMLDEAARALRDLHATRNPTETDGAHTKRVATAAQKFAKEIEAARERAAKVARDGLAGIEAQISTKAKLVPDAYAAEVRAMWRGMTSTEQVRLLSELIEQNRGPEFAAIVKAPRTLTGMPEAQRQHYEAAYVEKHAGPELLDRRGVADALEAANVAAGVAAEIASAYNDPGTLRDIARAEAAAAAASKKFDAAVGS